jgi:hypothetical protein
VGWFQRDREAQEQGETLPMPRELTDEELEAQQRREGLIPASQDPDLPWWDR